MNKRLFATFLVVIFMLSSIVAAPALAYDKGNSSACYGKGADGKISRKAYMFLENREDLGLSDDQIAKIKALKLDVKKELIRQNADIDIIGIDIKSEMYADTMNTNAINKLIGKKYDLKKAKAQYLVTKYAQLKNILTAEQKDKLKDIWKQYKKK